MNKQNRLVVADIGWAETIPEWIKEAIIQERLTYGLLDIMKGSETIGEAEILAYLYTANLIRPISHESSEIFIYLSGFCMQRYKHLKIEDLPDFCREKVEKGLTEQEQYEFKILKQEIYRSRGGEINSPILNILRELKKGNFKK